MARRKLPDLVLAIVIVASLLLGPSGAAFAAIPDAGPSGSTIALDVTPQEELRAAPAPPDPMEKYRKKYEKELEKREKRITPADRKAAADRAAAQGFTRAAAEMLAAQALPGQAPRYFSHPNYANSAYPAPATPGTCSVSGVACTYTSDCVDPVTQVFGGQCVGATFTGGIQKFVDPLPWGPGGSPMPVAAGQTLGDGSQYYEIGLVQYRQQMHSNLANPTLIRGYVELKDCGAGGVPLANEMLDGTVVPIANFCGAAQPSYLGPAIIAQKDTPVRILFRNLLPAGVGGDLFIPTDTSVMGSGMGPDLHGMPEVDPLNPTCDSDGTNPKPVGCFTENRADLHLHGGISPWISDGTPHQWITPADETVPYPDDLLLNDPNAPDHDNAVENKGVSVEYVPDMWFDAAGNFAGLCTTGCAGSNNPGRGAQTYYWTNQQSARLMFYHDHAWGITRLNVYAGEAAPYLIQDPTENTLTAPGGALDGLGVGIPLVLQDKTFVPSPEQIAVSDETWDYARWGGEGNMWLPHVYSPAQNPGDSSGVNQFGRWAYGPWFWPPTQNIAYGPVDNPYYDPACNPDLTWCEPPLMPGTPWNSMGMEAFHDTPVVNGVAYPTVTLEPKEHRFRILNAASDRFFNLSLYEADPANPTEVALNAVEVEAALTDPAGVFPTPDPAISPAGPAWVQVGTEGGFLPAPVVVPAQFITWVTDPTVFNAGNVDQHSLLLGPAERADVVIDLTPFAGKTLILYNDAPAAFPARDPRYDYYTGNPDLRDTGGAPPTLPGYGPNTRTVMQIVVSGSGGAGAPDYVNLDRLAALESAFQATSLGGGGVFQNGQHPIIVGQGAYNSAYGTTFQNNGPFAGLAQIYDFSLIFKTLANGAGGASMTIPFQTKAIQDEMGEAFDRDYGRMSGNLGLEVPLVPGTAQNLVLYPYVNPTSELIDTTKLPQGDVTVAPITDATDGTQIWKITHNGVDTHPIHFHLFDVQVLNRVGWDGIIRKVDLNELGWKDTVRISPLEDTIVALRPVVPKVPWPLPNSSRPLNPAMPTGSSLMFTNVDKDANPTPPIVNLWTNFGWEYVWHCHILSHEEMDMMRPISAAVPPEAPTLSAVQQGNGGNRANVLTWVDNSLGEDGFVVQRASSPAGPWTTLATLAANVTTYTNTIGNPASQVWFYQVIATNTVGYSATAGFSTLPVSSTSNIVMAPTLAAPTNLAAAQVGFGVNLTWSDNATTETGYRIERSTDGGATFSLYATVAANTTGFADAGPFNVGQSFTYRVAAMYQTFLSAYSNNASVTIVAPPSAPANVTASAVRSGNTETLTVTWTDTANNESGFRVQWATNATFTAGLGNATTAANATSFQTAIPRNTYYIRVQSFITGSASSAWVNATPFPLPRP